MARGRKPKPTHLKLIAGTFRKDRSSKNEPKPELAIPRSRRNFPTMRSSNGAGYIRPLKQWRAAHEGSAPARPLCRQ